MAAHVHDVRVVLVSPADVARERAIAKTVVDELNRGVAADRGLRLSLWRWEFDSRPGMHPDGPQGLIDELMTIQDADVVIGVFWKRFGTPTAGSGSGTEHELQHAWDAWRSRGRPEVMAYFCTRAYAPEAPDDLEQWQRVLRFRQNLPKEQAWWPYSSVPNFERLLRTHLTALVLSPPRWRDPATTAGYSEPSLPMPPEVASAQGTFVGRVAELAALAGAYAKAAAGVRRLVLLSGEPGVGKTRLAKEFAFHAHDNGAIVLYGRCDASALLAQQPFVEALRHYVAAGTPQQRADRLRGASGELQRMVPDIATSVPGLAAPLAGDPDGARSRLFEAVSALLHQASQRCPVVLILDDLHWADKATLLLLKYLIRYPLEGRLMVLGTYRDTELAEDHPLSAMLAELASEHLLDRYAITPLDAAAVSQLVGDYTREQASPDLRQIVYERTEGNAFFVVEVSLDLAESAETGGALEPTSRIAEGRLAVPERLHEVIIQRVARLGRETSRLLAAASVLGRDFELEVLRRLSRSDEDELVNRLESAARARVIEEVAGGCGRHAFAHGLIQETLYASLSAARRALLHRRAGVALEAAHSTGLEDHLAELAHHFAKAGSTNDLYKAIKYGTLAGEHAISQLAYEQAAGHFRDTVRIIGATDPAGLARERCDLLIAQGNAERQAGDHAYRQTLLNGAHEAQNLRDPERLAQAALANNRGFFSSAQGVDRERVAVLQETLDAYPDSDSPTRAALLSLLAFELVMDEDWRLRERGSATKPWPWPAASVIREPWRSCSLSGAWRSGRRTSWRSAAPTCGKRANSPIGLGIRCSLATLSIWARTQRWTTATLSRLMSY